MLNKLKKVLGIEGIKVFLDIPETLNKNDNILHGKITLSTMTDATVEQINFKMLEKYERGKKQDRRIDIYEIGNVSYNDIIHIKAHESMDLPFSIHFNLPKSEMDLLAEKNLFLKGIVATAMMMKNVKSEYYVEVEVIVKDTRLHPFDKKSIKFK